MDATDWTTPDAYDGGDGEDFHSVVSDVSARHMYRAFDRMAAPLDRAAGSTSNSAVRVHVGTAIAAMTAATATQDVLRNILKRGDAVPLAGALHDLFRALRLHARPGAPTPSLDLVGDVALAWAKAPTAWAIAAAVVEMVDEIGWKRAPHLEARFIDGHLALMLGGRGGLRRLGRQVDAGPPGADGAPDTAGGRTMLDRIADLLLARVVRGRSGRGPGVALVVRVRLDPAPPGMPE